MSVRALLIIAGFIPLTGCLAAAVGTAGAVSVAALQDRSMGEAVDDANASNELKTRLMTMSATRYNEVDVEVAGRVALLSGRVYYLEDRMEAERIAWSVGLIQEVVNEIQVRDPGGIMQNLNDEWITARVRSRMLTDGDVKSLNINIETYDGTVYLMGIARTQAELQKAAEHASKVRGVNEVVSLIQIRDPQTAPVTQVQPAPTAVPPGTTFNPYAPSVGGTEQDLIGGPGG